MEQQSWENWPLHLEVADVDDEEFLRDIILQQPTLSSESGSQLSNEMDGSDCLGKRLQPSTTTIPRTFILSFDKSTIIPATTQEEEEMKCTRNYDKSNLFNMTSNKRCLEPKAKASNQNGKKSRSDSQSLDHIMAERKRRLEISQKFIALSATLPGLKKRDKTSILHEAISYVKLLQERVTELEERNNRSQESTIIFNKTNNLCANEDNTSNFEDCCELLPNVKVRVLENEVLIEINCEKENGIELKILELLENLHLLVTASSVLPFGNSTLGITIIAQMGEAYKMKVNDLEKTLRQVLLNTRTSKTDPY